MAELTTQIQTINSGKGIIAPPPPEPTFMDALADFGNTAMNAYDDIRQRRRQAESDQRARDAAARAQRQDDERAQEDSAKNTAEQAVFTALQTATTNLQTAQTAEGQGRARGRFSIELENTVSSLYAQFPEQKATIAKYLQERGFNHYLFRELDQARQFNDVQAASERDTFALETKAAAQAGLLNPDTPPEEGARLGRELLKLEAEQKAAKEAFEASRASTQFNQEQRDRARRESSQTGLNSVRQETGLRAGGIVNNLTAMWSRFGEDPTKLKMLEEAGGRTMAAIEQYRTQMHVKLSSMGATPEEISTMDRELDNYKKTITDLATGPFSQAQMTSRALTAMTNRTKMSVQEVMPVYAQMSQVFGREAVHAMFQGEVPWTPEVTGKIKKEIEAIQRGDDIQDTVHLNNIARVLRGELNIRDMTEAQAQAAVPGIWNTTHGIRNVIAANPGQATTQNLSTFLNGYDQMANATVEIQPGSRALKPVMASSAIISDTRSQVALEAALKNPTTAIQARGSMLAGRGAAMQNLNVLRALPAAPNFNIQFDTRAQKYVLNETQQASPGRDAFGRPVRPSDGRLTDFYRSQGGINPALNNANRADQQKRVAMMNNNLRFLTETAKYDEDLPKNTPARSLREHYALGRALTDANGKPVPTSDQLFNQNITEYNRQVQEFGDAATIVSAVNPERGEDGRYPSGRQHYMGAVNQAATQNGIRPELLAGLIDHETGGTWNPQSRSPKGAYGLGQIMEDTARGLGIDRNDPVQNIDGAARYLRQMLDMFEGDEEKALAAYNAGPGNVRKHGGIPPFRETQNYVPDVLRRAARFAGR